MKVQFSNFFDFQTELKSEMSGSTEIPQLLMSVKEEFKEEEFDDFLQEYLSAIPKVEEKSGLEPDCKTEIYTSPALTHKEEEYSLLEIKQEETFSDLREYGHHDSTPTGKFLISLYHATFEQYDS